jgi:hypothetical protein
MRIGVPNKLTLLMLTPLDKTANKKDKMEAVKKKNNTTKSLSEVSFENI